MVHKRSLLALAKSYSGRVTPQRVARKIGSIFGRARGLARTALPGPKMHDCNACGSAVAEFHAFGPHTLVCPVCCSRDRERLLIALLDEGLLHYPTGSRALQIAPNELGLSKRLARHGTVVGGDLEPARYGPGTIRVDLQDMSGVGPFDRIALIHVLEHVPDDRRALSQARAALNPAGQLWIMVPLIYAETVEGTADLGPVERENLFGGSDHVRAYGRDIEAKIREAGFSVEVIKTDRLDPSTIERLGLLDDTVFVATRC